MPRIRVILQTLKGEEGSWFATTPDVKVADVKKKARAFVDAASKEKPDEPIQTVLSYGSKILSNPGLGLLEATGHSEELQEDLDLNIQVYCQEGDHECCLCHKKLQQVEDYFDDLPRWIMQCGKMCDQRICKGCWDGKRQSKSEIICPRCEGPVSDITSADTWEVARSSNLIEAEEAPDAQPEDERSENASATTSYGARDYQFEAFKAVCERNRIICLPTGTGKTLVAIMLIDRFLRLEDGKELKEPIPGAFTCFIVNTVALVQQQAAEIRSKSVIADLRVVELTGETMTERTPERWRELRKKQVLVTTAEVLRQAIVDHGFLQLDADCKLLVFDEAHHAIGKHPFAQILKKVGDLNKRPRLVGLTACYLHGKFRFPEKKKKDLERLFLEGNMWVPQDEHIKDYKPAFDFERIHFEKTSLELLPADDRHKECLALAHKATKWLERMKAVLPEELPEDLRKLLDDRAKRGADVVGLLGAEAGECYFTNFLLCHAQSELEKKQAVFMKGKNASVSRQNAAPSGVAAHHVE
ncbi:unnamed protein product [Durusdinium trenchii]|uniref:Helicase ATP-binding domain-containing protein n=1 Tax=Durusdinium trenchii TaxID=1381693 RepID=A0ABP0HHN3_9DINO